MEVICKGVEAHTLWAALLCLRINEKIYHVLYLHCTEIVGKTFEWCIFPSFQISMSCTYSCFFWQKNS